MKTGENGVLCIIYNLKEFDMSHAAHESVHIADYFFEELGLTAEDFSEGDENYAYMVGWATSCFIDIVERFNKQAHGKQ